MLAHLTSKTVWGLALAAAITLCQLLGFDAGGAYLGQLALMLGIDINPAQVERFTQLGALGLAYYGRVTATAPLGNLLSFLFKSSAKAGKPFGAALALALLGGSLMACGALPGNPQGYSGITDAEVDVGVTPDGKPYVKNARIRDGKEKQDVSLIIKKPGEWEVRYAATGVSAFDGQRIRGAVEEAVSGDLKEVAPGIVDSLTGALVKTLVPVP